MFMHILRYVSAPFLKLSWCLYMCWLFELCCSPWCGSYTEPILLSRQSLRISQRLRHVSRHDPTGYTWTKEEKCGNIAQLVESDLPIMFKCCIYSERFKYCLTFTKPLMVYFERTFLFCSRCTYERHENTIRINGSRADIQTGDLPTLITNLEHNRKTLLGIQILFFPKKDRIFKKLNFF